MLVMDRQQFASLETDKLGSACVAPTLNRIRGKSQALKEEVYKELTDGQKALLMFQILYGHAHSVEEFYWFMSEYVSQPRAWSAQAAGLRYFQDEGMLRIYEKTKRLIESKQRELASMQRSFSVMDLEHDAKLRASMLQLYEQYGSAASDSLQRIGVYIRNHPEQFVQFKD